VARKAATIRAQKGRRVYREPIGDIVPPDLQQGKSYLVVGRIRE
jgi:hypothetical protein